MTVPNYMYNKYDNLRIDFNCIIKTLKAKSKVTWCVCGIEKIILLSLEMGFCKFAISNAVLKLPPPLSPIFSHISLLGINPSYQTRSPFL